MQLQSLDVKKWFFALTSRPANIISCEVVCAPPIQYHWVCQPLSHWFRVGSPRYGEISRNIFWGKISNFANFAISQISFHFAKYKIWAWCKISRKIEISKIKKNLFREISSLKQRQSIKICFKSWQIKVKLKEVKKRYFLNRQIFFEKIC